MSASKLTPRQRMINLMYLVFIAMQALTMSKEVLSAFGMIDESLSKSNSVAKERNLAFMDNLAQRASESPNQYGDIKIVADEIQSTTVGFYDYIQSIKDDIDSTLEDPTNYEIQDQSGYTDNKFFIPNGYTEEGKELLNQINGYRVKMTDLLADYPGLEGLEMKLKRNSLLKISLIMIIRRYHG